MLRNLSNCIDYKQVEGKAEASQCFSNLSPLTFDPSAAKERARLTQVVTRQVKTEAKHLRLHVKDGHRACQGCWED